MVGSGRDLSERLSADGGYSVVKKGFLDVRSGLYVRGKDLCVLVEV